METTAQFSIPLSSAMDAAAAKSILTGSGSGYIGVISNFNVASDGADYPLGHLNEGPFISAQQGEIAPFICAINAQLGSGCP